jgi:hypothetical protein
MWPDSQVAVNIHKIHKLPWPSCGIGSTVQEEDNVTPLRPFCAFPLANTAFGKWSLSYPFGVPPNVNATNLEHFPAPNLDNMPG